MRCKTCGKVNHCSSKNTAHSWVGVSYKPRQQCSKCHFLGCKHKILRKIIVIEGIEN
tara:strand:+ start:705 stop:875 length:171 start_codon:yes stop_codon:yes gene_type:complete